jgi:hypothetical protein
VPDSSRSNLGRCRRAVPSGCGTLVGRQGAPCWRPCRHLQLGANMSGNVYLAVSARRRFVGIRKGLRSHPARIRALRTTQKLQTLRARTQGSPQWVRTCLHLATGRSNRRRSSAAESHEARTPTVRPSGRHTRSRRRSPGCNVARLSEGFGSSECGARSVTTLRRSRSEGYQWWRKFRAMGPRVHTMILLREPLKTAAHARPISSVTGVARLSSDQ